MNVTWWATPSGDVAQQHLATDAAQKPTTSATSKLQAPFKVSWTPHKSRRQRIRLSVIEQGSTDSEENWWTLHRLLTRMPGLLTGRKWGCLQKNLADYIGVGSSKLFFFGGGHWETQVWSRRGQLGPIAREARGPPENLKNGCLFLQFRHYLVHFVNWKGGYFYITFILHT